jgi:hypothetical protein
MSIHIHPSIVGHHSSPAIKVKDIETAVKKCGVDDRGDIS